jgi:hypothetical protein
MQVALGIKNIYAWMCGVGGKPGFQAGFDGFLTPKCGFWPVSAGFACKMILSFQ